MTVEEHIAICYHEAAHAVVAERLVPGSVHGIVWSPTPEDYAYFNCLVYESDDQAVCFWSGRLLPSLMAPAIFAGKWAEMQLGVSSRKVEDHIWGDMEIIRANTNPWQWSSASHKARRMVTANWDEIHRVAAQFRRQRVLMGHEIWELIRA